MTWEKHKSLTNTFVHNVYDNTVQVKLTAKKVSKKKCSITQSNLTMYYSISSPKHRPPHG